MGSNDITITITNLTNEDTICGVFQKPTEVNRTFQNLRSLMWKVFPLGQATTQTTVFPMDLQVSVIEANTPANSETRTTVQTAASGQHFDFSFGYDGPYSYPILKLANDTNPDDSISITNNSPVKVNMGLSKNGKPLIVQYDVASGDQAFFLPSPKIYVVYGNHLVEGDSVKSNISSATVQEIDLQSALATKRVELVLGTVDQVNGKKQWSIRY